MVRSVNMWDKQQFFLITVGVFVFACGVSGSDQKLKVSVYFESLCPDSHNFIKNQLHRYWTDVEPYVNLELVPFGKSSSYENGTKFVCQHGSVECKGNRLMSCALKRIHDQRSQIEYVNCFMDVYRYSRINKNEYGQECAEKLGLNFKEIMEVCYQTKEGTNLQLEAEKSTNKVQPRFVPTIVYNGVFDQALQDESLKNFREVVCNLVMLTSPNACTYKRVIEI